MKAQICDNNTFLKISSLATKVYIRSLFNISFFKLFVLWGICVYEYVSTCCVGGAGSKTVKKSRVNQTWITEFMLIGRVLARGLSNIEVPSGSSAAPGKGPWGMKSTENSREIGIWGASDPSDYIIKNDIRTGS